MPDTLRVIGIDPGRTESAHLILELDTAGAAQIGWAFITANARLARMLEVITAKPAVRLALERVRHYGTGMPAGASVFETAEWGGAFRWAYGPEYTTWVERREVKLHLCGNTRAKDSNIRQALVDRFGPPGTKKSPGVTYGLKRDLWQALAVAVTYADTVMTADPPPAGA